MINNNYVELLNDVLNNLIPNFITEAYPRLFLPSDFQWKPIIIDHLILNNIYYWTPLEIKESFKLYEIFNCYDSLSYFKEFIKKYLL